jgi:hypothetical protein
MLMMLIRKISCTFLMVVMAVAFAVTGAMAEPDAPRECTATGSGPDYAITMNVASSFCRDSIGVECTTDVECTTVTTGDVCITADQGLVRFAYAIDAPDTNPDHAVLCFDAVPVCTPSECSISTIPCTTSAQCPGTGNNDENEDVCVVDSECIFAAGETTNPYPDITSGLEDPGAGDRSTIMGRYEKSRRVMTANPNQAVSRFFVDILGTVTCDSGDILVKSGKKISSCEICAPLTSGDPGAGAFANTEKIVTLGNCRFSRKFENFTGKLVSTTVLQNAPSEPPCEGIAISTDQDGKLFAKFAGEGTVPPMPFSNLEFKLGDGVDMSGDPIDPLSFGFGEQEDRVEYTSGTGTCVTLSDGFGGTSLSCTCQKPLSSGEIWFCRPPRS